MCVYDREREREEKKGGFIIVEMFLLSFCNVIIMSSLILIDNNSDCIQFRWYTGRIPLKCQKLQPTICMPINYPAMAHADATVYQNTNICAYFLYTLIYWLLKVQCSKTRHT